MFRLSLSFLAALLALGAQDYTLGVGVYPGDPQQNFAPTFRLDGATYRNLALHRAAYQSSSYDYNLTAQLVTDGIVETKLPRWVVVSSSEHGVLAKHERENVLDHNWTTSADLRGTDVWVDIGFLGGSAAPEVDRVDVDASAPSSDNQEWSLILSGSEDGKTWRELRRDAGRLRTTGEFKPSIALPAPVRSRYYRVELRCGRPLRWRVGEVAFFRGGRRLDLGGPYDFSSAWMSAGSGEEWVYVDLGAQCTFDRVKLDWIRRAAEGSVEASDDAVHWRMLAPLPNAPGAVDEIRLPEPAQARYVRLRMTKPASPEGYILSEMEVWGRGVPVPVAHPAAASETGGRVNLAGGRWRVERESLVKADGAAISRPGFLDRDWLIATVPGTVLTSYLNAGAVPDPNYGDNQNLISDSFFCADFWYRDEFVAPAALGRRRVWLNFDGINWKADVYLNGEKLGRIEGAFMRGRFDVTGKLRPGQANALAVRIEKNRTPGSTKEKTVLGFGSNGGALGADNPTFHSSVGWDWMPAVRGRDTGIWNSVYLTGSGPVTIEDPLVSTSLPLPDISRADVGIELTLRNHEPRPVAGKLRVRFGEAAFEMPVTVAASSAKAVKLDPAAHAELRLRNPKLWWPNGYGDPNLYAVEFEFETADGQASDTKQFQAGVRQFTYSEEGGALRIFINGRRFVPRGGNWGFSEDLLRYRAREYDAAVRYHRDMNFTMIRNWVGQTGDDAFYEACDRYGIVVWQEFWLANPWDGPDPDDPAMFLRNVRDTVLRIRNHPSIGLYCGRNEGYPPAVIDDGIRQALGELAPGSHYISDSADGVVGGGGPYQVMPLKAYFGSLAKPKLHSEMGSPNIPAMESLRAMMPEDALWPPNRTWGEHDLGPREPQAAGSVFRHIEKSYGGAKNVEEFVELAQFLDYEIYRAMFESQSRYRMGMLIWMSHSAWPSLLWQTYDYYFNPGAGYFGSKKGSEPLHIQWNAADETIEVVNYSGGDARGLTARVEVLNLDGSVRWEKTAPVDSAEDSTVSCIKMEYPAGLTAVHFLRLKLSRQDETVSENFYWRGLEDGDYRALRTLAQANVGAATRMEQRDGRWRLSTELHNVSATPALMVCVKAVREKTGDRILPALYSDNYVALMPGESRTIVIDLADADTRGEKPSVVVEGFNVAAR
ncbi:MAG: discoidin domain-containing protein [Bryobacteraceae bacterium]|jgi:hypothetical protein